MESKIRHGYDALLVLRAPGSAALVADTVSNKVGIDRIQHGPNVGRYAEYKFDVVLHVGAGFAAGSDNVYVLNFNTYDAAGLNPVTHHTATIVVGDLGKSLVYPFDTGTLAEADPDASLFGIALDVTGTTPSADYWAFISPSA